MLEAYWLRGAGSLVPFIASSFREEYYAITIILRWIEWMALIRLFLSTSRAPPSIVALFLDALRWFIGALF